LLWSVPTYGSRDGSIDAEAVEIHEMPNDTSAVVEILKRGDFVTASNSSIAGFYKIRSESGIIGWAPANALKLNTAPVAANLPQPVQGKRDEVRKKFEHHSGMAIHAVAGGDFFTLHGAVPQYSHLGSGYFGGIEVSVPCSINWALIFRSEYIFQSAILTDTTTAITYQVKTQSLPFMIGPEYTWYWKFFSVGVGVLGGVTWPTSFQVTQQSGSNTGAIVQWNNKGLSLLGRAHMSWFLSPKFALFLEGGYRYTKGFIISPDTSTGTPGAILASTINIDLSGPILGGGVHFAF
jgi:hypothetical protein